MPCIDQVREIPEEDTDVVIFKATLCALFNELKRRGILYDAMKSASMKSGLDIQDVYKRHVAEDTVALKKSLTSNYSADQLLEIKKLLENNTDNILCM